MYSVICVSAKDWEMTELWTRVVRSITDTENTKIVLKTDGEPSVVEVQDKIINVRTQPTIPENPLAYDPQADGGAEREIQEVKKMIVGNKLGIGGQNGRGDDHGHLGADDPAGCGYGQKLSVGDDGRTACCRVRHKNCHGTLYEFGEQVLAKPKRSNKQKEKEGASDATWVG